MPTLVFSREELMAIGELALKYDAFVVTDEVYEHMVYAPNHHTCMASLPGMYDHTITCNSLSKTYSITGWRLGYLIGPEEVIKVHDFLTVAAVPGSSFFKEEVNHLIRLHFAREEKTLDEALNRLAKLQELLK